MTRCLAPADGFLAAGALLLSPEVGAVLRALAAGTDPAVDARSRGILTIYQVYCIIVHMNNTTTKGRFNYVVTMDERIDPRYLVDHMARHGYYNEHLVAVTDLQANTRVVGYAYRRRQSTSRGPQAVRRSFWSDIRHELVKQIRRSF